MFIEGLHFCTRLFYHLRIGGWFAQDVGDEGNHQSGVRGEIVC